MTSPESRLPQGGWMAPSSLSLAPPHVRHEAIAEETDVGTEDKQDRMPPNTGRQPFELRQTTQGSISFLIRVITRALNMLRTCTEGQRPWPLSSGEASL